MTEKQITWEWLYPRKRTVSNTGVMDPEKAMELGSFVRRSGIVERTDDFDPNELVHCWDLDKDEIAALDNNGTDASLEIPEVAYHTLIAKLRVVNRENESKKVPKGKK